MAGVVEFIHRCDVGIPMAFTCLGRSFAGQIGGIEVALLMPTLTRTDPSDAPKVGPPAFSLQWSDRSWESFFRTDESDGWSPWGVRGWWHTSDFSRGLFTVERFAIQVDVGSAEPQAVFEQVLIHLPQWWRGFKAWLEIVAAIDVTTVQESQVLGNELAWTTPVEPATSPLRLYPPRSVINVARAKEAASPDEVEVAAGLAGFLEPALCWRLIRGCRHHRWHGQWRASVLEAGTAAELALTILIDRLLATAPPGVRDALLDSHRTLGNRAKLFRRLGGTLPADFESLVRARNRAAHEGAVLSAAEATESEVMASQVVEVAEPLPQPRNS